MDLLEVETTLVDTGSLDALNLTIVNTLHQLYELKQVLLLRQSSVSQNYVTTHISSIAKVDRTAPFVDWHETLVQHIVSKVSNKPHEVSLEDIPEILRGNWATLSGQFILYQPLDTGERSSALLLISRQKWNEKARLQVEHLAKIYQLCFFRLVSGRTTQNSVKRYFYNKRKLLFGSLLVLALLGFLPVPLTVVAPSDVVPHQAYNVTAPFNLVVEQIKVLPNQSVKAGDKLIQIETFDLDAARETAYKRLLVTEANLLMLRQSSFNDAKAKAEVARVEAELALLQEEVSQAQKRLAMVNMTSPRAGVVIIDDPELWKGRPVQTGESIMKIADPQSVRFKIYLPIADGISLNPGARVKIFLDIDPLTPLKAEIIYATYEPELTASGTMAYIVFAQLLEGQTIPRIGLRASAKIYGDEVALFYYLFRRPLTWFRQWFGW